MKEKQVAGWFGMHSLAFGKENFNLIIFSDGTFVFESKNKWLEGTKEELLIQESQDYEPDDYLYGCFICFGEFYLSMTDGRQVQAWLNNTPK